MNKIVFALLIAILLLSGCIEVKTPNSDKAQKREVPASALDSSQVTLTIK